MRCPILEGLFDYCVGTTEASALLATPSAATSAQDSYCSHLLCIMESKDCLTPCPFNMSALTSIPNIETNLPNSKPELDYAGREVDH
jgi:hypothetical protein